MASTVALMLLVDTASRLHTAEARFRRDLHWELQGHDQAKRDVWMLARAVQGEGAKLFGPQRDEVGRWLAHSAVNFHETGWQPGTLAEQIEKRYHGIRNCEVPEPWALKLANEAIERKEDAARGARFVLSGEDFYNTYVENAIDVAIGSFLYGDQQLHFF